MLPYFESMGLSKFGSNNNAVAPKRLCYLYFPNGVSMPPQESIEHTRWHWFPLGSGEDYTFTRSLAPLESHRKDISILGGLSHPFSRKVLGHMAGDTWLTGGDLRGEYKNSISADQIAARHLSQYTRFPYLSLSTDGGIGYKSRVSTLSFDLSGRPIPSEHRQREIFERYFAPNGASSTEKRRKSLSQGKKIVDLVLEDSKSLQRRLGKNDQEKLDEYLSSLNQVEEQVKRNEKWLEVPMKDFDASTLNLDVGAELDPDAYIRSMMDLIVLGFQTDSTRVITYMMAREDGMGYGDNFPKLALNLKGHHAISHDLSEGRWEHWGKYDRWLAGHFAYFLDKMKTTKDEHGTLLDNTLVLYGSACSSTHNANNCPLVLAGGSNMGLKHGAYTIFDEKKIHLSNLLLSMLNAVGVKMDTFSDSTGVLPAVFS